MAAPRQMTAETLNALKGWPQMSAVDYHTLIDPRIAARVPAGAVVHVNALGFYELGVGQSNVMPLFTFDASDDFDVKNEAGDPATEKGVWVPISPTGQLMALVAVGAYELVSTHFVVPNGGFTINMLLTSPDVGPTAGRIAQGTLGTDLICGVVSRVANADGTVDNGYGHDAVAFWPVMFPVYPPAGPQ